MANQEHLDILKQGVEMWNKWRDEHLHIQPDLTEADFVGVNLMEADLRRANLSEANLTDVDLNRADLRSASLKGTKLTRAKLSRTKLEFADLSKANLSGASFTDVNLSNANLGKANLSGASFTDVNLYNANLRGADLKGTKWKRTDLTRAVLEEANFLDTSFLNYGLGEAYDIYPYPSHEDIHKDDADFRDANFTMASMKGVFLSEINLTGANFTRANLSGANLYGTSLSGADFRGADLTSVDLSRANLSGVNLSDANLSGANLSDANLSGATLIRTNFTQSNLTSCRIYGISAWDVQLQDTVQSDLIITPNHGPTITVDNLKIAQFIYLLLNNEEIRDVIDTIAKKAVLILGRFTPERKAVLDALRKALRTRGYVPILFDFDRPNSRNVTETVKTLAHLSRFIIADLTDPSSIPYELAQIVPGLAVPVRPILLEGKKAFAMFPDLPRTYHWVLPTYYYTDQDHLLATLQEHVIAPAEQKAQELEKR